MALSALGRIIRDDPTAWRASRFRHRVARHLPLLRERMPSTGPHGAFARGPIVNLLGDRSWIVRGGGPGRGRVPGSRAGAFLDAAIGGRSSRAVRIATASALVASGETLPIPELLEGADPAPSAWATPRTAASGWSGWWSRIPTS